LLAHGRWFSPGTLVSSSTKTGRHDITEILLKVALNTKNQQQKNNLGREFWILLLFLNHTKNMLALQKHKINR
jgi:hypothetical protein